MAFLSTFDPKASVIACGTVSTTALDTLRAQYAVPLYGVVEPAARAAAQRTKNGKVGLIGTQATIRSGAYERALDALRPGTQVTARACPLFVPLVENGRFHPGDIVVETVVKEYLEEVKAQGVDTLMLGCTHYPFARGVIAGILGERTQLLDGGAGTARQTLHRLEAAELLSTEGDGDIQMENSLGTPEIYCRAMELLNK